MRRLLSVLLIFLPLIFFLWFIYGPTKEVSIVMDARNCNDTYAVFQCGVDLAYLLGHQGWRPRIMACDHQTCRGEAPKGKIFRITCGLPYILPNEIAINPPIIYNEGYCANLFSLSLFNNRTNGFSGSSPNSTLSMSSSN